ncbi:hypothetical protein VTK73DRAFT_6132 [Phialemonium thermophilum]|uniref:Uncharacterized protein n=1 Tax=Phialemonium thermophilum TaxID=223376 RepID=A0ABR3V048_9PEZI
MRKSILGEEVLPDVVETKEGDEEATATATSTTSSSSSSSSSSSRRPLTEPAAASKIQWWWRAALRRRAFAEFASLGLTIDGVRETSFEQVTEILSREEVLVATAKVLRICGLKEGERLSHSRTPRPGAEQHAQRHAGRQGTGWTRSGTITITIIVILIIIITIVTAHPTQRSG